MIHYHGTPITPRASLLRLAGKHFCVSFAWPNDADWCLANGQSVVWDNGAFSLRKTGKLTDWSDFYGWLEPRLGHPHWAVIPDMIDGPVEAQRALVAGWPFNRDLGAPVWHMALPIDYLVDLANHWPRLCFGSSGKLWQIGSQAWERRCDEAFDALEKRGLRPWVHMLRGLALAGDRWPFASADSTNVAVNFKGDKRRGNDAVCPERMARRLDAVQSPIKWIPTPERQQELFG
jgi:hypothetical protein